MRILAISGSLRAGSGNSAVIVAAARLAPPDVVVEIYEGMGHLPHFNPDLAEAPIDAVLAWRAALARADAVLISSPEYAHGLPGSLKNALDWVVGSGELVGKPVALINASPRASHAQAQLAEILTVMSAVLVPAASIALPLLGRALPEGGVAADPELAGPLARAVADLAAAAIRP